MASGLNFAVSRMLFCFFVLLARVLEDGELECGIIEDTVSVEADICFYYFHLMRDRMIISVPSCHSWITNSLLFCGWGYCA